MTGFTSATHSGCGSGRRKAIPIDLEREGAWTVARVEDHNYMDALVRPGKLILAHRTED